MFDTHIHSHHSCDSQTPIEALAEAALAAGLQGLAITDHVEWMPGDEAVGYMKPQEFFTELDKVRRRFGRQLTLLAGVEVGMPHLYPEEARRLLESWPWDLVLGSVHWVDGRPGWEPIAFEGGLEAGYSRYFQELTRLAQKGDYDILAHFDLVRRESWNLYRRELPATPFADQIRAVLQAVVERGKGLEINTSGYTKGMHEPHPTLTILRWYRELGGEILVFGSDAHFPEDVARDFDRAGAVAQAAGFTHLARFQQRQIVEWIEL